MNQRDIPATPYARRLARENGVDLSAAVPTGMFGAVRARDVLAAAQKRPARVSPLARRIAERRGIKLGEVTGSGYAGKRLKADVLAAQSLSAPRRERLSGMRRVVAARMAKAHAEIPPVTHTVRCDVTALTELRRKLIESGGRKYSLNDFILAAVARALELHPRMLVSIDGEEIIHKSEINLGMAVAVESGLMVPVIRGANLLSLDALSDTAGDIARRAREGRLLPDEMKGSTFTVTNLGMYDVESFTPIINQPDAAILGVCCIVDELALVDGAVTVRKIMRTCLTYDHRLLDGAGAASFQREVKSLLENPTVLVR